MEIYLIIVIQMRWDQNMDFIMQVIKIQKRLYFGKWRGTSAVFNTGHSHNTGINHIAPVWFRLYTDQLHDQHPLTLSKRVCHLINSSYLSSHSWPLIVVDFWFGICTLYCTKQVFHVWSWTESFSDGRQMTHSCFSVCCSFYADFGPFSLAMLYRYCCKLNKKLKVSFCCCWLSPNGND